MYKDALRAAWAEINITNLDFNIKQIKEKVGSGVKITGVVKADAYGHGSVRVATVLRANGIESFAVATLSEAVRLRKAGFLLEEIMVLSPIPERPGEAGPIPTSPVSSSATFWPAGKGGQNEERHHRFTKPAVNLCPSCSATRE